MLDAMRKHWQVFRESWRLQNEADAKAKPRTDHEFLPAALEIMEKPPSPGLRWLLISLCILFAIALIWACIGKVDVVAVASGKVIPSANSKVIQPMEIGSVRAIHVKNGQRVKAGELLIELDPTISGAEVGQSNQQLLSAELVRARNNALLAHLSGRPAHFVAPAGTPTHVTANEQQYVQTAIAEFEAEKAALQQSRAEAQAQLAGAQAEIAKLNETLPLLDRQMAARKEMADKGYYSQLRVLEYEQARVEHVRNIDVQKSNAARARATIGNIDAQLARLRSTFGKQAVTQVAEAADKSALAADELRKTARRQEFQQLRSPVDGVVQQLAVTTVGGVVQPAQALMVIVPDDQAVAVEAMIQNKDVGFIHEGQPVRVKLEAFPFTDYGLIEGVVETISRDAIDMSQNGAPQRDANGRPVQQGLVYATRIKLNRRTIIVNGVEQPIGPGLAVQAEIKTGERRIIQYLLSPISQTMDEAGKER